MRIHTNLCRGMLDIAAKEARVTFERCTLHGSRTHDHAFDVILSGNSGRRANFGGDWEAATWDQWGIFLARIFADDPQAKCWAYTDADDFHWQTDGRFRTLTLTEQCPNHKWVSAVPYEQECRKCGAVRRWKRAA